MSDMRATILTEVLGTTELDTVNHPTALVVEHLVTLMCEAHDKVQTHAGAVLAEMERVLAGRAPSTLASHSFGRDYDAAVVSLETLRQPLSAAVFAHKRALGLPTT